MRSSCTYVHTEDVDTVIDPAVALAPRRDGLPPHPVEEETKSRLWRSIRSYVDKSDIIIVSHYHYDHVDPKEPEIYGGKKVLLKHPSRMINQSQKRRSRDFISSIKGLAEEIDYADNKTFSFDGTKIRFSKPVPHGSTATRGYVVEVCFEAGETFLYTSDVQGPVLDEQLSFILEMRPETLFVDGPTTYIDSPLRPMELRRANDNLLKIVQDGRLVGLIVDHHLTRDLAYRDHLRPVWDAGLESGVSVQVAAEFLDMEPNLLEARRRELYGKVD